MRHGTGEKVLEFCVQAQTHGLPDADRAGLNHDPIDACIVVVQPRSIRHSIQPDRQPSIRGPQFQPLWPQWS